MKIYPIRPINRKRKQPSTLPFWFILMGMCCVIGWLFARAV